MSAITRVRALLGSHAQAVAATIRIVTANLSNPSHSVTRRQQQAALRTIRRRQKWPEVIAVQEAVLDLRAPVGYRKFSGRGGVSELAIFVRKTVDVTGHDWKKCVDGVAGHFPDRGYVWVRTSDGTMIVCLHPNSKIDAGGAPRQGLEWRETQAHHFPQVDDLIRRHKEAGDAVVAVADWNVGRTADRRRRNPRFPFMRMRALGLVEGVYQGASLGDRAVDRPFYDPRKLRASGVRLMKRLHKRFDHRPVVLDVTHR